MSGICLVDIWYTYGTVHVWWAYGTCLVHMWYLFDRCLVGVDRCLVGHLTVIWQSSGNHLTGATRQIANVWQKRWCKQPFGKGCEAVVYRICMTMGQTFLLSGDSTPTRLLCACDCDSVRRLFLTLWGWRLEAAVTGVRWLFIESNRHFYWLQLFSLETAVWRQMWTAIHFQAVISSRRYVGVLRFPGYDPHCGQHFLWDRKLNATISRLYSMSLSSLIFFLCFPFDSQGYQHLANKPTPLGQSLAANKL